LPSQTGFADALLLRCCITALLLQMMTLHVLNCTTDLHASTPLVAGVLAAMLHQAQHFKAATAIS